MLQHQEKSRKKNSTHTCLHPVLRTAAGCTKWSLIFLLLRCHKPLHFFSTSIHPVLPLYAPLPNTQHWGCAWVKHYNSSRKWPSLRNFQGAVKGRRLMPGQALQGPGSTPHPHAHTHISTHTNTPALFLSPHYPTVACPMQMKDSASKCYAHIHLVLSSFIDTLWVLLLFLQEMFLPSRPGSFCITLFDMM